MLATRQAGCSITTVLAGNPMHTTPARPAISLYFNPTHGTFTVLLLTGVIMMARYLLPH